jgi:hypothetical protein
VLRRQELGGGVDVEWSIVDRAICSEPLARLDGNRILLVGCAGVAWASLKARLGDEQRQGMRDADG